MDRVTHLATGQPMLAMTGCGDDPAEEGGSGGSAGSAGSGGSAGSAGANGGPSGSTCEAIRSSSCVLQGVDPETAECLTQCQAGSPMFNDNCGAQADAYLRCLEGVNCNPEASDCQAQAVAWGTCLAGVL